MRFTVNGLMASSDVSFSSFNVTIAHEDKSIKWNLSSLGKTVIKTDKLFDEVNEYLRRFNLDELDRLYKLYNDVINIFLSPMSFEMIHIELRKKVAEILDYFDLDSLMDFVRNNNKIPIPSNFIPRFQENIVKNITRDRTYTREDYVELLSLVIAFKALLPIFAEYINIIKSEVGNEYKELYVMSIIYDSIYKNCRPIEKLADYIKGHLKNNFDDKLITMKGMNDEEYIDLTVAKTIIRKLIISDISVSDYNHNLITYVYKFVTQKKKENEKGGIVIKQPLTSGDSESNISTLEQFKLKEDVSIGDIVPLEYYLSDRDSIAVKLYKDIDFNLLNEFQLYSDRLNKEMILDTQATILRIMFKNIVSPKSILYLPKNIIINFIAIGSTVLWQKDLKYLSLLLGAVTRTSDVKMISNTGSKGRISQDIIDRLNELFPYGINKREAGSKVKLQNVAIEAIDILTNKFTDHVWYSTASMERISEALQEGACTDARLVIPHRIRDEIGRFIILANE